MEKTLWQIYDDAQLAELDTLTADYKKFLDIDTEVKINPRSFVSERKCDPKSKRFLMATRFVYAKGLDLMMESFEEFCKQDDEWQLDIIGAGDLWNQIVADAKRRGIEDRMADGYHGSL